MHKVIRNGLGLAFVGLTLTGCDTVREYTQVFDQKTYLEGVREDVASITDEKEKLNAKDRQPVVLPPAMTVAEWPQAGQNAAHKVPHVQANDELEKLWDVRLKASANKRQRLLAEPVVANGQVFLYTPDSYVRSFDLQTGEAKWKLFLRPDKIQDALIGGGVAFNNGTLFVSTPFAEVFAIDAETGKPKWIAKTNGPLRASPTVAGGKVFVVSLTNEISAFDENSGDLLWSHAGIMEYAGFVGGCTPSVAENVVVVPYSSGEIYALRADNGYPMWSETLMSSKSTDSFAGIPHIRGKPVIIEGKVFLTSNAGRTAAFDLRNGQALWQKDFGGTQTPLVAGDNMYLVDNDNRIMCVSTKTGATKWIKGLHKWEDEKRNRSRIVWSGPVLAGSKLYLTTTIGAVYAIDATTGELSYKIPNKSRMVVPPIAVDGKVLVVTEDGHLIAYS